MENNFNNREFEQFVKQNADQYRMFPSEKVWKGIHHTLHTRRRWYGLGLILLLVTTAAVTLVMLNPSGKNQSVANLTASTGTSPAGKPANEKAIAKEISFVPSVPVANKTYPGNKSPITIFNTDFVNPSANAVTAINDLSADAATEDEKEYVQTFIPVKNPEVTTNTIKEKATTQHQLREVAEKPKPVAGNPLSLRGETKNTLTTGNNPDQISTPDKKISYTSVIEHSTPADISKKNNSGKKVIWQVYVTPTISYRKLKENTDFITSARASNIASGNYVMLTDVNNVVTHKPDIGIQLGIGAGYPIAKNLRLLAGLQFNVSKYNIKAYKHSIEVATIALDNGYYSSSVSTYTNYRNFGGYSSDWLHNLYISASVPLGMEWLISNSGKTQFGISGTIQPTYVLGERAYLLSTDYKNYAEVPSLTRNWNMNTSFEAFAGYKTGKLSWRIGPQVRYQLMSSFKEKYPVKEHLFDFGLKMGVQITK